jgi:hypothetical protein
MFFMEAAASFFSIAEEPEILPKRKEVCEPSSAEPQNEQQ